MLGFGPDRVLSFNVDGWVDLQLSLDDGGLQIKAFDKKSAPDATGPADQIIKTEAVMPFSPKVCLVCRSALVHHRQSYSPLAEQLRLRPPLIC